jgi:hypothetical protein
MVSGGNSITASFNVSFKVNSLITYTATADGSALVTSTKIRFVFSESITGLTSADISPIGAKPSANKGNLTGSGTTWDLALGEVFTAGSAGLFITKSGIDNTEKKVTLYKNPIVDADSQDLSVKFGITTAAATPSDPPAPTTKTVKEVRDTFAAVHSYLGANPAQTDRTSGSSDMPGGLLTKIGDIALGDYIDLVNLSVAGYPTDDSTAGYGKTGNLPNMMINVNGQFGYLLRLIVVGINTFNQGQSGQYDGSGNGSSPHLVFQFQHAPATHRMDNSSDNVRGYAASEMRKYLVQVSGDSNSGRFLTGLYNAGVPINDTNVVWAPKRYVANGGNSTDMLQDLLWLPTEREMFGINGNNGGSSIPAETATNQARLAYYGSSFDRVKGSLGGGPSWYWEASPNMSMSYCRVVEDGTVGGNTGISAVGGVAPAFCIR